MQDEASKVVEIAKKHGYEFTEDDYTDLKMEAVAGGIEVAINIMGNIDPKLRTQFISVGEEMREEDLPYFIRKIKNNKK